MGIVIIGAVFVDIKGYPGTQYIPGGRNVGNVVQVHGGVSRNVAEDIANLELRPTFVSVVDYSGTGTDVIERLNSHRVNTKYIRRDENGLGTWLAVFDNSNDVIASISKRPDLSAVSAILDECGDEIFSQADSIVLEVDMDKDIIKKIYAWAAKYDKKIYGVVSNMSIAMERRDLLQKTDCIVCNSQEAGMLFSEDYTGRTPEEMKEIIARRARNGGFRQMVVTLGEEGAVYTDGTVSGICPPQRTDVIDTTGAGDAFFAGVAAGLTYGKTLSEACSIGTRLASAVIATKESCCPRFQPEEFDLHIRQI